MNFLKKTHRIFILKDKDKDVNVNEILETVESSNRESLVKDTKIDVYSDCKKLFYVLNKHKDYYDYGVINKNTKKNTQGILIDLLNSINPNMKIFKYSNKKQLREELNVK